MKQTLLSVLLLTAALPLGAATLSIAPLGHPVRPRVVGDAAGGYSVDLPIVGSVRGISTRFVTSLDVTNSSAQSTDVEFTYIPADGSAARSGVLATLGGFDNLHIDDFVQSLVSGGLAPQSDTSFGTLLITFTNPSFRRGSEASVIARIYSLVPGSSKGTYGLAYRAPALQTNGAHSLSSLMQASSTMLSNIGIENVGINDAGQPDAAPVTVRVTMFDPATGLAIGNPTTVTLTSGQVVQINDVTHKPAIVFVDQIGGTAQIRGYVVMKDAITNDGSFVFMQESPAATF